MESCVAHIDLDAFYASVELLRRPELRGLPLVVAGSGPRAVVTTASYEARRFGIGSAMPASRARRLCPQAVFVAPDFEAYGARSREVMAILRAHVARVEAVGLDEAYADLSDLSAPHAAMHRVVAEIRARTGLGASVGIGPNRVVAKVASDADKPGGFLVLSREQACERFADASPRIVPGIGPKTAERLERLGLTTLRALADAPDDVLVRAFGSRQGPWLRRRAGFEGSAEVGGEPRVAVSESRETTFDHDIAEPARLEAALRALAAQLCDGLRRHGRRGRTIAIKIRLSDFTTVTRARTIAHATDDREQVADVAVALLRDYSPARPVRLLGVRVASFEQPGAGGAQLALDVGARAGGQ